MKMFGQRGFRRSGLKVEIRASGAEYYLFRPSDWLNDSVEKVLQTK